MATGFATPSSANHSWGNYHWARTSNSFTLKLGDNVSPAWDTYLEEAIVDWSVSSVLDLTEVNTSTTTRQRGDGWSAGQSSAKRHAPDEHQPHLTRR